MQGHSTIIISFLICAAIFHASAASVSGESGFDPETLDRLRQMYLQRREQSEKRGLDLGFDRGYSGKMAAKYLTGLEMAGPLGPGRRRRSGSDVNFPLYLLDGDKRMPFWNSPEYKRGLDLGFGRGFSGVQAARHLIGLEEANDAMGPGRRRRSVDVSA